MRRSPFSLRSPMRSIMAPRSGSESPMRITLALLMLAAATSADAQVVNPDFDTGMTGWAFVLGYGGIVDWDAAAGDPAGGSALAGNIFAGPHRDGWKQCVPFAATDFTISARVASALQTGNRC